jgi:hypothetical protein
MGKGGRLVFLRALSFKQIRLLVAHVVFGVAKDGLFVLFFERAAELPGRTHPERVGLNDCLFGDQSAGGDDRAGSNDGSVQDDAPHADEAARFDGASVKNDGVADGDVVAYVDSILLFHAMEDGVVLDVGVVPDADLVYVATENSVHPDAGMLTHGHVSDQLRGFVDVAGFGELGSDAFVRADHEY